MWIGSKTVVKWRLCLRVCICNAVSAKLALGEANLNWKIQSVLHATGLYKEQDKSAMVRECHSLC